MKKIFRRLAALTCALALCLTCANALTVEKAIELMEKYYLYPLPAAAYEAKTLDELFDNLDDPYTYYMDESKSAEFTSDLEGEQQVDGIGAIVEFTADGILITSVYDGSGAQEAGLRAGDTIIAAEGVPCVPGSASHRERILGEPGTYVTLTVRRSDGSVSDFRVRRSTILVPNTTFQVRDGAGYIDCNSFGNNTGKLFTDGIRQYNDQVAQWVVDLRGNIGGYSSAAAEALSNFTGSGVKVYYRYANGELHYTYCTLEEETNKPVIVLINGETASSSELFASDILADGKGIAIGSRSYGKGVGQIVLGKETLPDVFDQDTLKVTAFRFYSVNGVTNDHVGVLPTLYINSALAPAVAALLSAEPPETENRLRLPLNGVTFYIDLDKARSSENADALSALFSALPPDVPVYCPIDGMEIPLDPATAAKQFGIVYEKRGFSDAASSPYVIAINTLAAYGILQGDGTGRFHPASTLTRAELSSMLSKVLNVIYYSNAGFSDVPQESWFAPSVNAMAWLGFMQGVGNGRFDPNGTLTQAQLITVMGRLARFLNLSVDDYALSLTDEDLADNADLARLPVWARTSASVLTDYDTNMLYANLSAISPSAPATRDQAAAVLCNMLKAVYVLNY